MGAKDCKSLLIKPMLIFGGQGYVREAEKKLWDKRIAVTFQRKATVDAEWMQKYYVPAVAKWRGDAKDTDNLLIIDSAPGHIERETKKKLQRHSTLAIIPGNLTLVIQYLDVAFFGSFKRSMQELADTWAEKNKEEKLIAAKRRVLCTKFCAD
eukprot:gene7000-16732_t